MIFSLFEKSIYKKNKKICKNFYLFKGLKFNKINFDKFKKEKTKYSEKIIFPEKKINTLIKDIFINNKLSQKITEVTGYNYTINYFIAYKIYKLDAKDIKKNIYANYFHKDKPYSKNMIKLIFSFNEITKNNGPMQIKSNKLKNICLKKDEIFLFHPSRIFHRATSPKHGVRFQIMFQLNPSSKWQINKAIFDKQQYAEPRFPFFSYFFDKKKILISD
tara:strand:+ start:665 stop:1318 length:654 start_codon:yes stop_codon:yes gene_type:complete